MYSNFYREKNSVVRYHCFVVRVISNASGTRAAQLGVVLGAYMRSSSEGLFRRKDYGYAAEQVIFEERHLQLPQIIIIVITR